MDELRALAAKAADEIDQLGNALILHADQERDVPRPQEAAGCGKLGGAEFRAGNLREHGVTVIIIDNCNDQFHNKAILSRNRWDVND